jgi:hypothetical protein
METFCKSVVVTFESSESWHADSIEFATKLFDIMCEEDYDILLEFFYWGWFQALIVTL